MPFPRVAKPGFPHCRPTRERGRQAIPIVVETIPRRPKRHFAIECLGYSVPAPSTEWEDSGRSEKNAKGKGREPTAGGPDGSVAHKRKHVLTHLDTQGRNMPTNAHNQMKRQHGSCLTGIGLRRYAKAHSSQLRALFLPYRRKPNRLTASHAGKPKQFHGPPWP